jgi:phosphatidylserine/phosphatidylglycerophosphate/cardiolipin synthase-like enzyme
VDEVWQATCFDFPATSTHVPEVLRYYLPDQGASAFSMYRTHKRDEADEQIAAALAGAQHSIDTVHVNFTLEMICDLNVLFNVCSIENSLSYMDALLDAAENNGARLRILVYPGPIEGIENLVTLELLMKTIEQRGLSDLVELRLFEGPMHYKASLVDEQFLIVGSQNFHYSAFSEGAGLAEYSLGTDSPQAVEDFQQLFEYHWSRAKGIE